MLDSVDPHAAAPVKITPPAKRLGIVGGYFAARRNVVEFAPAAAYREPMLSKPGFAAWKMLMHPPSLEHVLKTRARDYPRSEVTRRILKPREGENVFTAEWEEWRRQHRALTPIFQQKNLMALSAAMTRAAAAASERLAARQSEDETVDVYDEMITATYDVINDAALSGREQLDRNAMLDGVTRFIEDVARISILDILGAPRWIPRPGQILTNATARIDAMIDAVIEARQARGPSSPPDLLDLLIAAEDGETGRRMTKAEIRNTLSTFIIAGHETTALALTWALYLLALHPKAQARARDEAQAALGDAPAATAEHLPALGHIRRVIDEALRLYPPAGFLGRTAKVEDEILGEPVRPGETIMIPVYTLHRHRALWEAPDAFAPERFEPEAVKARHRYAYLPFGAGPRICIGMQFALIEATLILASLVARFRFEPTPATRPRPVMHLTLRPEGGMPLRVTRL